MKRLIVGIPIAIILTAGIIFGFGIQNSYLCAIIGFLCGSVTMFTISAILEE